MESNVSVASNSREGPNKGRVPALERYGHDWICRDREGGSIIANFEGVAYSADANRFVYTRKLGTCRGYTELGARSYEAALAEAKVMLNQLSLGL